MIAIPNMEMPKSCGECEFNYNLEGGSYEWCECVILHDDINQFDTRRTDCPLIEIVTCGECKHRPIKDDPDGEDYGFNIVEPTDGDDLCPYLVEDGWYSWMPNDNFYCGRGERSEE